MDFFYDEQIRRYILQFIRIFADIKTERPPDENGVRVQKRVPITYGDMSRMVAHILRDNSQNTSLSAPAMSAYIQSMELSPNRRQDTMFVRKLRAVEREYDEENDQYTTESGNRYTIESYMPVPYDLTMNLDIWTTTTTDKLQILEQILTIFNPSIQIQTHHNPLDWSTIFEVELTGVQYSNKSIPQGTSDINDFATLSFKVPIWINPAAKVTRQRIVEQIVATVFDVNIDRDDVTGRYDPLRSCFEELDQMIITPGNHRIEVSEIDNTTSKITLLTSMGVKDDTLSWNTLIETYGRFDPDNTKLRLKTANDIEDTSGDILGSIELSDTEENVAIFTVDTDTLPTTMIASPVNAIVDPSKVYPGSGLPISIPGQRYLLLSSYVDTEEPVISPYVTSNAWGGVLAYENDIIEYNGTDWVVIFDASESIDTKYAINIDDGQHYKFNGTEWVYTYLGVYNPGYWRIEN